MREEGGGEEVVEGELSAEVELQDLAHQEAQQRTDPEVVVVVGP